MTLTAYLAPFLSCFPRNKSTNVNFTDTHRRNRGQRNFNGTRPHRHTGFTHFTVLVQRHYAGVYSTTKLVHASHTCLYNSHRRYLASRSRETQWRQRMYNANGRVCAKFESVVRRQYYSNSYSIYQIFNHVTFDEYLRLKSHWLKPTQKLR